MTENPPMLEQEIQTFLPQSARGYIERNAQAAMRGFQLERLPDLALYSAKAGLLDILSYASEQFLADHPNDPQARRSVAIWFVSGLRREIQGGNKEYHLMQKHAQRDQETSSLVWGSIDNVAQTAQRRLRIANRIMEEEGITPSDLLAD